MPWSLAPARAEAAAALLPRGAGPAAAGVLAVLLALALAPASDASAAPRRKVLDRVVAVVDDACITRSELDRFAAPPEAAAARELGNKPGELARAVAQIRREALEALVDRALLLQEAARARVELRPTDVDTALAAVAAQNGITIPQLLAAAAAQGLDEARYRAELRAQILEGKLLQEDATKRFPDWQKLPAAARPERMARARALHLAELREKAFIEVRP